MYIVSNIYVSRCPLPQMLKKHKSTLHCFFLQANKDVICQNIALLWFHQETKCFMKKALFIFLGTLSLSLGLIGIVVPGLPTTSFLLLTAYLYARSSKRLHDALMNHKLLGGYIKDFQKGMTVRAKLRAIFLMWAMILLSAFVFIEIDYVRIIVIAAGVVGTFFIARVKGREKALRTK